MLLRESTSIAHSPLNKSMQINVKSFSVKQHRCSSSDDAPRFGVRPRFAAVLLACLWFLAGSSLFGQTPVPAPATNLFMVKISPTNGTIMVNLTTNAVFVNILNYTNYTNITVVG